MTESAEKEPTMEEILSSIRRIISEEDEESGQDAELASARAAADAEPPEADVLELTDPLAEEAPREEASFAAEGEMLGDDILIMDRAAEATMPGGEVAFAQQPDAAMAGIGEAPAATGAAMGGVGDSAAMAGGAPGAGAMEWGQEGSGATRAERLLDAQAAAAAAGAFARLARTTRVPESAEDKTLEAIVRELLRPMLKDWLDTHLPGIVEKKVREEVERIARQG